MSQCQSAKTSQSLRNENDLKPNFHDLENIFDSDEEIEPGDSVSVSAPNTCLYLNIMVTSLNAVSLVNENKQVSKVI